MATRTQVVMIDDLTGKELDGDGRTVTFSYQNTEYAIDLSAANAEKLKKALEPYIKAAQKVGRGRRSKSGVGALTDKSQLQAMRVWARRAGYTVSERGRVSREIQDAYHSAN